MVVKFRAVEVQLPLKPTLPQEAVQVVAFVLDQVRRVVSPALIVVGEAERVTVGAGVGGGGVGVFTVTVADFETVPPNPVQVTV